MEWSSKIAASAQRWADTCSFRHTGADVPYGENIAWGGFTYCVDPFPLWYDNEVKLWRKGMGFNEKTGVKGWGVRG